MIDINELRKLTQAATPGPWINYGRQSNAPGLPHSTIAAKTLLARVYSEAYGDSRQETANASFIAAANPAVISELLDRLEAAERERDALRAKLEAMERQEPVAEMVEDEFGKYVKGINYWWHLQNGTKLYALPGAKEKRCLHG